MCTVCVAAHAYVCMYVCMYVYMYLSISDHACVVVYLRYMYVCMYVCMHVSVYACMRVCIFVRACVHLLIYNGFATGHGYLLCMYKHASECVRDTWHGGVSVRTYLCWCC